MSSDSVLANLVREGKLKRQKADLDYLNDILDAARRNFEAARFVQSKVDEAAFKLIYDGLLQVSRVVILLKGYKPGGGEQHKTAFLAAREILGPDYEEFINKIQKFRIKRNECIYDPRGLIGKSEAEAIHKTAKEFWAKVRDYLEKENPQLKLFKEV
jgi:uncharacterized protein (UPF0332 family)